MNEVEKKVKIGLWRQRIGIVVRAVRGAAQHQMAIGIALGFGGNHTTVKIDGQEMMLGPVSAID